MGALILLAVGVVVGAIGALVGVGGGFLLVPILLALYPEDSPSVVTTISLAIVLINSLSASAAYWRAKRIDVRVGLTLAAATVPGSIVGALIATQIERRPFTLLFGTVMIAIAALLFLRPSPRERLPAELPLSGWRRLVIDRSGQHFVYTFSRPYALATALVVGVLSSLLGIGGGVIQVPLFIMAFNFPVLIATATSSFMLVIMSLAGLGTHVVAGHFDDALPRVLLLAPAVIGGSQIGVWLSRRIQPMAIARLLAVLMVLAAGRMLMTAFAT